MNLHAAFARLRSSFTWLAIGAAAALLPPAPAAGQARQMQVSQVHQILDAEAVRVRAYLNLVGEAAGSDPGLVPEALTATLGEQPLKIERVEPMRGSGEGVAYIFLIDISRSLSQAEFDRIVAQIESWIAGMTRADQAAIIAFGETVRLVSDFTADREDLVEALWSLGPTDDLTLLHRALVEALELAQRRDAGLPGRRALVVLTDGRDEGSGLTTDDVLARLRSHPAPLYAIGFSRLRDAEERRRYLDLLLRLATNSGGAFFEADRTELPDAYREIRDAVQRVWLADLSCADCPADGREYRFQATLSSNGRVLSDGQTVRIFPPRRAAPPLPPAAAEPPPADPGETAEPPDTPPQADESTPGRSWVRTVLWILGGLAALLALAILRRLVMGKRPDAEDEEDEDGAPPVDEEMPPERELERTGPGIDAPLPPPLAPPARARTGGPLRPLRLVVVRGSKPGREYRLILQDRAVVGKRSTCDCVLVGEPNVAPEQFELIQRGGRVYVNNLAEGRPTLLDGFPVEDNTTVERDHLIGTGDLILRIVFD